MSTAARLVKLAEGLDANGVLSAAKGGTGGTTGGGTTSPTISAIGYGGDDTAANPAGGQTITLTGTNFATGARVLINTTAVGVVTVVSPTQITFTAPALSAGSYILYVVNTDGSTAIAVPGIQYSGTPAWTTAAGSLGTSYETGAVSTTVSAASDSAVSYSVVGGTLPSGVTINASGTISGTSPIVSGSTTYTFTVRATDLELQDTDRQFSLTVNPDVVSWSTPTSIALQQDPSSTTTLSATSAAGQTVSYSVDTLPAGLTLSGATVSGTATTAGTTSTIATATAAVTGKTAQQTITWTVSIAADAYWKYTTLLLNAETAAAPFLSDASANNFSLIAFGDARPSNFGPYTTGYYSVALDSQRHLSTPANSAFDFGNENFTVEAWVYFKSYNSMQFSGHTIAATYENNNGWNFGFGGQNGINGLGISTYSGNNLATSVSATGVNSSVVPLNKWHHVAVTKSGSTVRIFVNGVGYTTSGTYTAVGAGGRFAIGVYQQNMTYSGNPNWNISNLRVVKGTAVYTTDFTPSITPLTAVTGTSLLACQGNRFVDASANAFPLTASSASNISVSSFVPFVPNSSYSTRGSTYFDGSGDYLTAPSSAAFAFGTGNFTIEFWVYFNTVAGTQDLIGNYVSNVSTDWIIIMSGTGIQFYPSGSSSYVYSGGSSVTTNTWYHVAAVRSGSTCSLYVNGTSVGTPLTVSTTLGDATKPVYIGARSGPSSFFNGYIADVRVAKGQALYTANFAPPATPLTAVTNTSLLTCQTNQPHTNSQFLDNSSNALAITRTGNSTQGSFSPYGSNWSNYFDGTGDNLSIASSTAFGFGTGDFTIEFWAYSTSTARQDWVDISDGTNRVLFYYTGSAVTFYGNGVTAITGAALVTNAWVHYALVKSSGSTKLYVNGTQAGSTYATNQNYGTTAAVSIGKDMFGSTYITGNLSNFRIVKGTAVYTGTFTPPTTPLTPIANTGLLTCADNRLVDDSINNFTITKNGDVSVQRFSPFNPSSLTPTSYSGYFDGTGDYLSVADSTNLQPGSGDLTYEFWWYPTTFAPSYQEILTKGTGLQIYAQSAGPYLVVALSADNSGSYFITNGPSTALSTNTWYHIAVTRSGNNYYVYLNGVQTLLGTSASSIGTGTDALLIGAYKGPLYYTFGYISNVRFVKGTAVYTSNFTPPTSPLTAISGTQLLTCQSPTFIDNSTNNFTITAIGNSQPTQQNPFGFTTATTNGYTVSTIGGSGYFDGTGDYLSAPSLISASGDFTIECWFNTPTTLSGYRMLCGGAIDLTASNYLAIYTSGVEAQFGSASATIMTAAYTFIPNTWNHLAMTRSGTTIRVYVNGVSLTTVQGTQSGTFAIRYLANGYNGLVYTGYISDFRFVVGTALYTSNFVPPSLPLTAVQNTSWLINATSAGIYDAAMMNNMETVGDAKLSTAISKFGGSSMSFDGSGDYLTAPASTLLTLGSGAFTIETWLYISGAQTQLYGHQVLGTYPATGNGYALVINRSNNGPLGIIWANGSPTSNIVTTNSYLNVGQWYHLAVVRTSTASNGLKIYLNGVNVATGTDATNDTVLQTLYIASQGPSGGYFPGYLDDLRITKGYARYTTNFTPPSSALLTK